MIYTINEQNNFKKTEKLFEHFSKPSSPSTYTNVEFVKKNGNTTFGIVKESGQYIVKSTNKKSATLFAEDFNYLEGYENRRKQQRKTLQEAIKFLHLIINEDKYVLDVPNPTPQQPAPAPSPMPTDSTPDAPIEPDGSQDAELDAGAEGETPAESDDEKEIQKLTGTLAQDLRTQIDSDNEQFTVGMFKSIIAAAKNLSPENKTEVMNKAEEVLNQEEDNQGEASPDVPTDNQDQNQDPMNKQQPVQESLLSPEEKEASLAATQRLQTRIEKNWKRPDTNTPPNDIKKLAVDLNAEEPSVVVNRLEKSFGDLPECIDYKSFSDKKHGGVRFVTTGKFDLIVLYWATIDVENYDVYVVEQKQVAHFLDDIYNPENRGKYLRNSLLDKNYSEIIEPIKQFLSSEKKVNDGTLNLSKEKVSEDTTTTITMTKKQLFESLGIKKKVNEYYNDDDGEDGWEVNDNRQPEPMESIVRPFNKINWKEVYDTLVHNEKILEKPQRGLVALNIGDLEDEHLINRSELQYLERSHIIAIIQNAFPVFWDDIITYDNFIKEIQLFWDKDENYKVDTSTADEQKYFGGHG